MKRRNGMPKATFSPRPFPETPKPIDIRRSAQEPRLPKPNTKNDNKENN